MNKVAIVILNWNGEKLLEKFLPNVVEFSTFSWSEVVVADNGSTDDSIAYVKATFPKVRVITLDRNYGFAEGYNRALLHVEAEYFLLLNSDVEVSENWLKPLLSYMDMHKEVAACGPKILSYKDKTSFEYAGGAGGYIDKYAYPFCRGRIFTTLEKDKGQYNTLEDVMWVSGCAIMVRASVYNDLGGLDSKFFAHQEEIDLCWRFKNFGYRVVFIPNSVIYHVGGASLNVGSPRKTYLNFRNSLLLLYKNLPDKQYHKSYLVRVLLDSIAAIKFLFTDSLAHFTAVFQAHRDFKRMRKTYSELHTHYMRSVQKWQHDEMLQCSVVKEYYIHNKKIFTQLNLNNE